MNNADSARNIRLRPELLDDLAEIILWYEAQVLGLGTSFSNAFFEAVERASTHPESRRVVFDLCRRMRLRKFPYSVYYLIESDEVVFILLSHAARDPVKLGKVLQFRSRE